ncbi:uncharacterized protein [Haliotis asinina]|uniref:uncharacterized protein n=1 Tax=Haliotis asinina TaxID=109174 RepID=UPI003531FCF7
MNGSDDSGAEPRASNMCDSPDYGALPSSTAMQHLLLTVVMVTGFVCTKTLFDNIRRRQARVTVVVIGAGPIGLTAVLVAARSRRVGKIILFEEMFRKVLLNRQHQIAFDHKSIPFLKKIGVDFDNIEGCWDGDCFYTRVGIFQEYLLDVIQRIRTPKEIRLGTKFTREHTKEIEYIPGRKLVIVCDGANGQAVRTMGLSDEFVQHTCKAYAAVAAVERPEQHNVPMPERRVHNLHFDLTAYGTDTSECDGLTGFSLKIFGSSKSRYMTLIVPKCESPLVKTLRVVLDRSMMRNIFMKCFNTYKSNSEHSLSDSFALKLMKFSPRLFEIKLSQRLETVAYFEDSDTFVVAEGDAARCYNFHTGLDVNIGIKGIMTLPNFLSMVPTAMTEHSIMKAMMYKSRQADQVCKDFVKNGLRDYMFSKH